MRPLRLGGVPVHPSLVHFPIASWTAASALAVGALWIDPGLAEPALHCNAVGLGVGTLAGATGFLELVALTGRDEKRDAAARHMLLTCSAWTLYLVMFFLQLKGLLAVASAVGVGAFATLAWAGHTGGTLVYRHGVPERAEAHHD